MNELALFAGAGGGLLGSHLLGWRTVAAVERDAYAAQVLAQRQNDGALPAFPIWSDVCSFDGRPWSGLVDVVSGGFPCQDISIAGAGAGLAGARSGLWREYRRIVCEVTPRLVYAENSAALVTRGLDVILADPAALGFDVRWGVLSAAATGAPHLRERIWILAHADSDRQQQQARARHEVGIRIGHSREALDDSQRQRQPAGWFDHGQDDRLVVGTVGEHAGDVAHTHGIFGQQGRPGDATQGPRGRDAHRGSVSSDVADAMRQRQQGIIAGGTDVQDRSEPFERSDRPRGHGFGRWPAEPALGRVADGVAYRVDRIKAIGNGQVPRVAAAAFTALTEAS